MGTSLDLSPGVLLGGRYEIVSPIGYGSLATVYKARDPIQDRTVALKVLAGKPESVVAQERHTSPTRIGALCTDSGFVRVWDIQVGNDPPFVVLEFVDGSDLAELIKQKCEARVLAQWGANLCSTLAALHECAMVHANLEPANILVPSGSSGVVKLTDFGVFASSEVGRFTSASAPLGPEKYRSPEVCAGHVFDQPADIYAAGQILVECLTGQVVSPAWPDDGPVRFDQKDRCWIDPAWSELLYAMTSVAPQDRPSAGEAARELNALAAMFNNTGAAEPTAAQSINEPSI